MRLALALVITLGACADKSAPTSDPGDEPNGVGGVGGGVSPGSGAQPAPGITGHPRIVLDKTTRAALQTAAKNKTRDWSALEARCEIFMKEKGSGYLGLQWAEAVASLSLCWHATGTERYATMGVRYLTGLVDDRQRLGDGLGGDEEVRRNSGYPIRAHGVWSAIGYDWLHDAPGMTPALKKRIATRLTAWLGWYGAGGYLNDNPYANYFWGYMTSLAMAGLAFDGDIDQGGVWLSETTRLLDLTVIPAFTARLRGGAWAEGWQYGPLVSVSLAMIMRGFQTARGIDYSDRITWMSELVRSHLHRLHPDRETAYSNGKHSVKPAVPSALPLAAVALALGSSNPTRAAEARFVAKLPPRGRDRYPWFTLLASLTGTETKNLLDAEPTSYHLGGPGLSFMRSTWNQSAVWASFQAGPRIAMDHQHNDQGHFELWRGSDALIVDGGSADTPASINHNTLLIDDAGRALNYTPNQGVWGKDSRTVAFADDGHVVTIIGDIANAWIPKCASRGCKKRGVTRAIRTLIYVRPDILVIDDRLTVGDKSDRATFAAHVRSKPTLGKGRAAVEVGSSRADMTVLSPPRPRMVAPREPTTADKHIYRRNDPLGDVWRMEISSPTGDVDRHFRVWFHAQSRGAAPVAVRQRTGAGIEAAVGDTATVVFASAAGGVVKGVGEGRVAILGLDAGESYKVALARVGGACQLTIARTPGMAVASEAGALSIANAGCKQP